MAIKLSTLAKIKKIVDANHAKLLLDVVGPSELTQSEKDELRRKGVVLSNENSVLERLYHHNYLNEHDSKMAPTNLQEMDAQQDNSKLPKGEFHSASKKYLVNRMRQSIEKQKADLISKLDTLVQESNNLEKFKKQSKSSELMGESTLSQLKTKLRDLSQDASRNWDRVVNTEVSNAVSLGSVDRIVDENSDRDLDEVYVYRIVVQDGALCRYCRRFYLDSDGSPKLYRLSTLLGNGSNYGKNKPDWKPVATATHPNERCSQVIELKPGWKLMPGGSVTFIGRDAWNQYLAKKLEE